MSEEGLPCVNTIEQIYLGLLIMVFVLAVISSLCLHYYKFELRKIFDSRLEITKF